MAALNRGGGEAIGHLPFATLTKMTASHMIV